MTREFHAYDLSHLVVLFLTLAIPALMVYLVRVRKLTHAASLCSWFLAFLLLGDNLALLAYGLTVEPRDWIELLPMHLCDWLTFSAAAALIWKKRFLYECTYFIGLAGTLHGLLTPDLHYAFPHFYFFAFFIAHGGIIAAILFLTFGLNLRPYPVSMLRAFLAIQFYLLCAAGVNLALGTNFGYLKAKPINPSLMDYLGPWPWYLLSMEGLAVLFFLLYYLPWWIWDMSRRHVNGKQ